MGLVVFFRFFHSFIQQNIALLSTIFQAPFMSLGMLLQKTNKIMDLSMDWS